MKALLFVIGALFVGEVSYYVTAGLTNSEEEEAVATLEKATYCPSCKEIDPQLDDLGLCCGGKPELIDVRVQTVFICSHCGNCGSTSMSAPLCSGATLTRALQKTPLIR